MKIEVYYSPAVLDEHHCKDKKVVVIDVFRASTTIVTALMNGAKEVVPVDNVETATKIAASLFQGQSLLCGERNGKRIEGFDLGNSPASYTNEFIGGKTLVFCSTNGSVALVKAKHAKHLTVCSFLNLSAVKTFLLEPVEYATAAERRYDDIIIVCGGLYNDFSLEDTLCAGMLVDKLTADLNRKPLHEKNPSVSPSAVPHLSDAALAAQMLYRGFRNNYSETAKLSQHGKYLAGIGFESDLDLCVQLDTTDTLPVFEGGVLKLRVKEKRKFKKVELERN
jgi:2-phosphosulfolactate phosphatase